MVITKAAANSENKKIKIALAIIVKIFLSLNK